MVLIGTIVNVLTIIVGTIVGLFFTTIKEQYKKTIMQGIALVVIVIGIQMALQTTNVIIVLLSMLFGSVIGEYFKLEEGLNKLSEKIIQKYMKKVQSNQVAQAFVTASILFVVGAMAIVGSLDSGIRGDHELLYTKSVLDGFSSLVLTTTLGFGVILSVIPLFLFQGTITLLATEIQRFIHESLLDEIIMQITSVGGIIIMAIGLNLLQVTKIKITNLIPSLLFAVAIVYIMQGF